MPDLSGPPDAQRGDRELASGVPVNGVALLDRDFSAEGARVIERTAPAPAIGPPALLFERVSKWYGPVIGVNQVTLELRPGITGLVGHNGAGKSTLMRLAAGLVRPDLGIVRVAGLDAWSWQAKLQLGYCPELDVFFEEMSGRRFVLTMARLCGYEAREAKERTERALELVGMHGRSDTPLAGYSKGMRQRIKLAQALVHDPAVLLLDEPLSGIDPVGRRELIAIFLELARRGKTLLVSSHELDALEKLTDRVAIMAAGRIAAVGTLPQIRDLLADHPLSIRIACDRNRHLATLLLGMDEVVGIERPEGDEYLLVQAVRPQEFFTRLNHAVIEEQLEIRHLETLDESTEDILSYLLGGRRRT